MRTAAKTIKIRRYRYTIEYALAKTCQHPRGISVFYKYIIMVFRMHRSLGRTIITKYEINIIIYSRLYATSLIQRL